MKKLFLGVMMFTLILTSCNKYANDFQALKDQIALLSQDVKALKTVEDGIALQAAKIQALQDAIAALPTAANYNTLVSTLGTLQGNINDITTTLNQVKTTGGLTKDVVDGLVIKVQKIIDDNKTNNDANVLVLADLQAKLALAATAQQVSDLQTAIEQQIMASATVTNDSISALSAKVLAAIAAHDNSVTGLIAQLQGAVDQANTDNAIALAKIIADMKSNNDDAVAAAAALQAQLDDANNALALLLANASMYTLPVSITTDEDVLFFLGKLNQMAIIQGDVTVNTTLITNFTGLNEILTAIIGVIGSGHNVSITAATASPVLTLDHLTSVRGNYTVTGNDITDTSINDVGGTLTYNYDGAYDAPSLHMVQNLRLVNRPGTTNINVPNVNTTQYVYDHIGFGGGGDVNFNNVATKTLVFGKNGIHELHAANATDITINTVAYANPNPGLHVHAALAVNVNLGTATTAVNDILIDTPSAKLIDLSKLVNLTGAGSDLIITGSNAVKPLDCQLLLNAWDDNTDVTINGVRTVTIPSWVGAAGSRLFAADAYDVTLAKYAWFPTSTVPNGTPAHGNLNSVKNLILGSVIGQVELNYYDGTLLTADITGATPSPYAWSTTAGILGNVTTSGNSLLTDLKVSGVLNTVNVTLLPALTGLHTWGVVNTLSVDHASIIEHLDLNHNAFFAEVPNGGPGANLTVTNNDALLDLNSNKLDWLHQLWVEGNPLLADFNFSSFKTLLNASPEVVVYIDAPATMGAYTHSYAPVGAGNAAVQAIIKSNQIMTIKDYIIAASAFSHITNTYFNINIGIPVATTLDAVMATDAASWTTLFAYTNLVTHTTVLTTGTALNTLDELSLVVAQ